MLASLLGIFISIAAAEQETVDAYAFLGIEGDKANLAITAMTEEGMIHVSVRTNQLAALPEQLHLDQLLKGTNLHVAVRNSPPSHSWLQYDRSCNCWYQGRRIPVKYMTNMVERVQRVNAITPTYRTLKSSLEKAVADKKFERANQLSESLVDWLSFLAGETNQVIWTDVAGESRLTSTQAGERPETLKIQSANGARSFLGPLKLVVGENALHLCKIDDVFFKPTRMKYHDFFAPGMKHPGFYCMKDEGIWRIQFVFKNSNAFRKGLRPGHQVLTINGKPAKNLTYPQVENHLLHSATVEITTAEPALGPIKITPPVIETYYENKKQGVIQMYRTPNWPRH